MEARVAAGSDPPAAPAPGVVARIGAGVVWPGEFEAVYRRYFHPVCEWIHALGGREADLDDLAQEVFLVVRRRLPDFDGQNLPGWLYGITRRVVAGHRRRSWYRRWFGERDGDEARLDTLASAAPDPQEYLERRQGAEQLDRLLARMSDKRRVAFVLFEVYGHSGPEIAEMMGVPLKTMWSRLHQARGEFQRLIAEDEGEGGAPLPLRYERGRQGR